jgi:hypothetical protein
VAEPPRVGVRPEYSPAERYGACPARHSAGHDDETRHAANSCAQEHDGCRCGEAGCWQPSCYGSCYQEIIWRFAPRTLDACGEMCKLRFRYGYATNCDRRRDRGFPVSPARGRVFLRPVPARPFGRGAAPRYRRSRAGAGEMGQGNGAPAGPASAARARGAVPAARAGDFREFDRARFRKPEASVARSSCFSERLCQTRPDKARQGQTRFSRDNSSRHSPCSWPEIFSVTPPCRSSTLF